MCGGYDAEPGMAFTWALMLLNTPLTAFPTLVIAATATSEIKPTRMAFIDQVLRIVVTKETLQQLGHAYASHRADNCDQT